MLELLDERPACRARWRILAIDRLHEQELPAYRYTPDTDPHEPSIRNPVVQPGLRLAELNGSTSSEIAASLAPGACVVKVANTLPVAVLSSDPKQPGGHRVLFMSGNDAAAKTEVSSILEKVGFATIDLGALATGGRLQQFPGGVLPTLNLIKLS